MNDIEWIYLIDNRSSSFLIIENETIASLKLNKIPLLHFLFGLRSFVGNFNKDEIKFIKIIKESYYLIEEKVSKSLFILKSSYQVKQKRIFKLLKEVVNCFNEHFNGNDIISLPKKQQLFISFKREIRSLILQNRFYE